MPRSSKGKAETELTIPETFQICVHYIKTKMSFGINVRLNISNQKKGCHLLRSKLKKKFQILLNLQEYIFFFIIIK